MIQQLNRYRKEIALNLFAVFMITFIPVQRSAAAVPGSKNRPGDFYAEKAINGLPEKRNPVSAASVKLPKDQNATAAARIPGSKELITDEHQPEPSDKKFIGGPGQPEMSAFKSVNADNIVDLFTGDFSYNIPLLDVGGYPVNLFYNGGITMDQQASWVGLGFNINPGTIMRNMRGVPDDFDGSEIITKTQTMKPDKTWGITAGASAEIVGVDALSAELGLNFGVAYNNQRGIALEIGVNPSVSLSHKSADEKTTSLTFGANLNVNSQSGASITPSISVGLRQKDALGGSLTASLGYHSRMGLQSLHLDAELSKSKTGEKNAEGEAKTYSANVYTHGSSISFAYPSVTPTIRTLLTRKNFNVRLKFGGENTVVHPHTSLNGYYTETRIAKEDKVTQHPAYGIMYYQKANNDKKAMLDFNRLNDGTFTKNSPTIAIPVYTYDVFSISGEGVGGSFRAYRGDLGYVRDEETQTREDAGTLGVEFGGGNTVHGGVNLEYVFTPTTVGAWNKSNLAKKSFEFKKSERDYQSVYFKNPGEKAIPDMAYQNAIGGEDLVRLKMINQSTGTPALLPTLERFNETKYKTGDLAISSNGLTKSRDKRTQVITCFNGEEADRVGFDKKIYSYDPNSTGVIFGNCNDPRIKPISRVSDYRRPTQISEIDVLGEDGRKYIYGIPVFNTQQVDVTFNIENGNPATQQSTYTPGSDDGEDNSKGKDWFMEKEVMPAYTHSFLLTALVSPNYVDVKGDGITEDDMGDAIKFNYSQFENGYKWRTPVGSTNSAPVATWNEGMKTDNKDDKAHYIYGEREMWYLYSVESKNMVARFYVADDRKDDKEVDITGKVLTAGSQRLTKISLFSKADLLKPNPKPIKTVYFEYSYKLCKGVPGNVGTTTEESGKLTLESIYFSYNGNEKQKKNRYKFSYAQNPNYDYNAADRWGNYKPATANQGGLSNADYPYSVSDKTQADLNAAAWTLSSITLPSGGKMDIDYESDDYAYVQDRKASSMYKIIGFGKVTNPSVAQRTNAALYSGTEEFDHVYIEIPYPITSTGIQAKKEIETRYLNSKSNQLFMKLAVVMPSDTRGSGFEMVPMYADIMTEASEPYGVVAGTNGTIIYIKVRPLESQRTPMVQYALQFIKNYLPFKAFPGYDVSENGGLKSIIMALAGMRHNLEALSKGEDNVLISEKTCKFTEPGKSFVRLTNPFYKRYGGGHRVKKVTLRDSWNTLGKGYEATYGQEYKYTTTELINGAVTEISSGVASWEPSIGGEENPHREILRFLNKNKGGPFDFGSVELPLAEMFFPSASVGYSKVEVLSIHRDAVKNAPGRTVSEYFTTKDFPTKSNYTSLADGTANVQYKTSPILQLLKIDMRSAVTVSQGFLVSLNDMNGKLKSQAAYSATDPVNPVTYTQNFYNVNKTSDNKYQFNHTFPVIEKADGFVYDRTIGREVEVMTDFRQHKSETITTNINFNTDFFMVGPFPIAIPAWFQPTFYESNTFRSAAMLKVVNHYAVLDSVVSIDKGSMVSTKNLVYDAETGNALVSRTNNEHNKPQYSFSYPAHWAYPGMGLAYKNIDALYEGLVFRHGILETPIDMSIFESGDEIYVFSETRKGPSKISPCDDMNGSNNLTRNEENKIWAVYTGKTASLTPQFIFIDKDGNPYTADKVKMRIIRSGKRNLLNQGAGGTTSLNSPVRAVFGPIKRIVLDDLTGILQTTAATYKDHWRVDNAFYLFDSAFKRSVTARIKLKTFVLEKNAVVSFNTNELTNAGVAQNADALLMRARGFKNHTLFTDFWLQYKRYAPAIANATVIGAKLKFLSDTKKNLGNNIPLSHYKHIDAGSGLHDSKWSHYTKNTSRNNNGAFNPGQVLLMNTSWPTSNTGWNNLFKDPNRLLHDWNNGGYIPQTMVQPTTGLQTSDKDYIINNNRDERITLPASLIQNWFTSTATQPEIGFRVMKARRSAFFEDMLDNRDAVQCFATLPKTLEDIPPTPVLSVYYYVCDDTTTSTETEPFSIGSPLNQLITCSIVDDRLLECRSKFSRKAMNPYVEGIWGNWRVDTSFVYYGDRKERDPNAQVDTRIGGTIENFKYFWNFAAFLSPLPMQRNYTAYDVWVWNSTITQYNRKGYEIENKDALGRFNAGLYGYNQQLPIAVANNSRYREIMFDGFEDYGYQTASCTETCPPRRHAIINNVALNIDNTQKHSGRYSLKVNPGTPVSFSAPVTSEEEADKPYWMRVKVDSTSYQKIAVTPIGTGFRGKYYFGLSGLNCSGGAATTKLNSGDAASYTVAGEQINFPSFNLPPNTDYNKFAVRWEGYVQPLVSGNYSFLVSADDGYKVSIILPSGTVTLANRWNCFWDQNTTTQSVSLVAGQTYKVTMDYFENSGNEFAQLMWKTPENPNSWQAIPKKQVYTPEKLGDATGTVVTTTAWCTKVDEVQVRGNALTDVLSLIQGRKMVVSTWVKEGGNDCKCTTYDKNSVNISFTGAGDTYSLKPAGSIIEGWQRYEGIIVIPATATMMNVTLNNTTSGQLVYFDDFRIHPFNSNMKSFVYHSSNLRLMSELDENNYASFYEYDDDGTLIRVKKETERGIKTITETRSALQNKIQ